MDPAEKTMLFWGLSKDGRSEAMRFEEELPQ